MSRLTIPIRGQTLWSTGDTRLWVDLDLLLKDGTGNWRPVNFRVDSATDVTTFSAFEAKSLGLPIPKKAPAGATHTQTGLEIRSGFLHFRIAGMDATEYAVSCLFLGDPDTPPSGNPAAFPRPLLQPLALLARLRFTFDKNATLGAPHGEMIIEKK
jgi:hypothetical protein